MHLKDTLLAGAAGSLATLAAVRLFPRYSRLEQGLDQTLAAKITGRQAEQPRLAAAVSLAVGMLFAPAYVALWEAGVGRPGARDGLILGALHGGGIVVSKPLLERFSGGKLDLPRRRAWMTGEVLDHALYGVVLGATYRALRGRS